MSAPNEDNQSNHTQLASHFFGELLSVMDVASECHRIPRLGLDHNLDDEEKELRLSAQARARVADPSKSESNCKYAVDIFGQTHPSVAAEVFNFMKCGRTIVAGRFAPHLPHTSMFARKGRLIMLYFQHCLVSIGPPSSSNSNFSSN